MKKLTSMMAVLLAAIIGSILLIGCPDETGTGDGTRWTARTSNVSGGLAAAYYANNLWVAVGGFNFDTGTITTSANGTDWTAQTSNVSGELNDIHYANGLWGCGRV